MRENKNWEIKWFDETVNENDENNENNYAIINENESKYKNWKECQWVVTDDKT